MKTRQEDVIQEIVALFSQLGTTITSERIRAIAGLPQCRPPQEGQEISKIVRQKLSMYSRHVYAKRQAKRMANGINDLMIRPMDDGLIVWPSDLEVLPVTKVVPTELAQKILDIDFTSLRWKSLLFEFIPERAAALSFRLIEDGGCYHASIDDSIQGGRFPCKMIGGIRRSLNKKAAISGDVLIMGLTGPGYAILVSK